MTAGKKKGLLLLGLVGVGIAAIAMKNKNTGGGVYYPPNTGGGNNSGGGINVNDITKAAKQAALIAWGYSKWDSTSGSEFAAFVMQLNTQDLGIVFNYAILKLRDSNTIAGMQRLAGLHDITGLYP